MPPSRKKTYTDNFTNPFKDCPLGSPIGSNHDLTRLLTSQQIDLFVGSDRNHIQVPRDILGFIPFFRGLEGGFVESNNKAFELPEETSPAVEAVVGWLFRGTSLEQLQGTDEISGKPLLASVLLLADKWCIDALKMACCNLTCRLLEETGATMDQSGAATGGNLKLIGDFYHALEDTRYRYIPIYCAEIHYFGPKHEAAGAAREDLVKFNRKELWSAIYNHGFWTEFWLWRGILASSYVSDTLMPTKRLRNFLYLLCRDGVHDVTISAFNSLIGQGCDNQLDKWPKDDASNLVKSSLNL